MNTYTLKPELTKKIKITHNKGITTDTIKVFEKLHPDFNSVYLKRVKPILQSIYKNDKIVKFKNRYIYFHTYRLLLWIYQYINMLDYYQSDDYKKYSFAKHKSASSKFERDYNKNKKEALECPL